MTSTTEWPAAPTRPVDPVYVLGCGSVGTALALALARRGLALAGAHCRSAGSAARASAETGLEVTHGALPPSLVGARTVILAVPDPEIRSAAASLSSSGLLGGGEVVLHCSGARSADELAPLRAVVRGTGSFHPLLSFADRVAAADHLAVAAFGVEGDAEAVEAARGLAGSLGGEAIVIEATDRPLYHAAAAVASNHLVALAAHAARCLAPLGVERDRALRALLPLIRSTVTNLERLGLPDALTGPVSRGDAATVRWHLEALDARAAAERPLYIDLARQALVVAREQAAASPESLGEVGRLLGPGTRESS